MRYFILGKKASGFWDPTSRTKIITKDPANAVEYSGQMTPKMQSALQGQHIVEVFPGQQATSSATPAPSTAKPLTKMTDAELVSYYEDNFELQAKQLDSFKALSKKEKVALIRKAEEESEEETEE